MDAGKGAELGSGACEKDENMKKGGNGRGGELKSGGSLLNCLRSLNSLLACILFEMTLSASYKQVRKHVFCTSIS